ncbi:MAG: patatin-like phospholipase family protein [Sporichthyaceae bacterium]
MGSTAFVLGGGGMLGAAEVGMLQSLADHGVVPDLILGTSVGAINGAAYASAPGAEAADRLARMWAELGSADVFGGNVVARLGTLWRSSGTHLYTNDRLRSLLREHLPSTRIEDLPVRFQCVAACVERACAQWFAAGDLADAVLASCAVPGLLPPVRIDGEHFLDGGLVNSLPVDRAVALGATEIYALHVGRLEQPLRAPQRPWEIASVAFEIARRSRFTDAMAVLPSEVTVHVLPTGTEHTPIANLRFRSNRQVPDRIERARAATAAYLKAR